MESERTGRIEKDYCLRWREFKIGDLFDIATGRDVIIGRLENGSIPLISHQNTNNGITKYIKQIPDRRLFDCKKTISLADRGIFWATSQDKDFHIGTRVKALTIKEVNISKECLLFLTSAINKLQVQFSEYLTNATNKLPNLKIKLPITPSDQPNWKYMETYIKAMEKLVIKDVVEWKDREIEKTREIVL